MDGDGKPDIISSNYTPGTISVLRNTVTRPYITSFTPTTAGSGAIVSIKGVNFTGTTAVSFGGTSASSFFVDSSTNITAVIDSGTTGDVKITTAFGTAIHTGFTFSHLPTISSFTPAAGGTGTVVTITGTNFIGTTAVNFGDAPAVSFNIVSASVIEATVGTTTTGSLPVSVTTPSGTAILPGFYTGPAIHSFAPSSGPVGTTVTIAGTHFSSNTAGNIVYFGAVKATVLTATSDTLIVTVPTGASYQPISVTTNNLMAWSAQPFIVTFKGTGGFTPTSFDKKLDSVAGNFPTHGSIMDLNSDGKPDVVVTNFASSSISVFNNTSNSGILSFSSKNDYSTENGPIKSATSDLDGDGKPDVIVLNSLDNINFTSSFSVFRNTTTGGTVTLAQKLIFSTGYQNVPVEVAFGDLDGDGKTDLAVVSYTSVSVFKNTSTAGVISFAPKVDFHLFGQSLASSISISDVDGDGKADIIATDRNLEVAFIFRNTSLGGEILFAPKITFETGFAPASVSLGDLDNDGKPDMAITNPGNNSVSLYKNTSSNGIVFFEPRINYPLINVPYNVSISDLDGDGKPDLAIATRNNSSISVLRNTCTRGSISFADKIEYTDGYNLQHVSIGDMNGDGKPDLVAPNPNGNNFSVLTNEAVDDGLPEVYISASGPTEFCEGENVILKVSAATGSAYQWYDDGIPISSAIDSIFTATVSGTYSVKVTNGSYTATSAVIRVTVRSVPGTPVISLLGSPAICGGSGTVLVSSAPDGNQWYKNDVLLSGITDRFHWVNTDGTYKVVTSSNGCTSLFSNGTTVTVNSLPPALITVPATTFCEGDSVILTANTGNGLTYQWNVNENPVAGAKAAAHVAKIPGNFSVLVTSNGCSTMSEPAMIVRTPLPEKPAITQTGANLVSSAANGNQWYRNGVAIPGATSQTYTPTNSANYSVAVIISGCASPQSENYNFTVTGIITIDNTHFIKLSPNPVRDQLRLSFNVAATNSLNIELIDFEGRVINVWKNLQSGTVLNLSHLSNAVYIARIYSNNNKVRFAIKVAKQ